MSATVHKLQQRYNAEFLEQWTDLWFTKNKKAGYVAITDFKKQLFFGSNDIKKVMNQTALKKKQFISINAFDINWKEKNFSRETANLKQIRNIAIDIDQYKLNITIEECLDEIQAMILKNVIPEPNMILTSRGIQLFYSISHGASPKMAWLASYITEQLISKLQHIGADSNAKDMSRVMRVPNSINERNNAIVKPVIWNDESFTLQELQAYCKPLDRFKTRKKSKDNLINLPINEKLNQYYKTNYARLRDLRKLIDIRKGNFTGMRNAFLYMYSYHQSLVLNTQKDVLNSVINTFKDVYSTEDKEMSKREFENTVKSAYKDAEEFFNHFVSNGYKVIYKSNDGIKKPYTTANMIDKLNITEEEQYQLGSVRNKQVAKQQHADYMRNKRQQEGTHKQTKDQYNKNRRSKQLERAKQLANLLEQYPNATQRELAEMMKVSPMTVSRLKKAIEC